MKKIFIAGHKGMVGSSILRQLKKRGYKNIIVKTNQKIKFNLLYDKNKSLQKKIKLEQLRKETS